ncbi:MAG: hypothetical protein ACI8RD_004132 [Bacillariaceae sp.]|jgi:hypothetical protein
MCYDFDDQHLQVHQSALYISSPSGEGVLKEREKNGFVG